MQNPITTNLMTPRLISASHYLMFALIFLIPASPTTATFWLFALAVFTTYKHSLSIDISDKKVLLISLSLVLLIGIVFSIDPFISAKISLKMLAGFLAIYGVAKILSIYPVNSGVLIRATIISTILLLLLMLSTFYSCNQSTILCGYVNLIDNQNKWTMIILLLVCAYSATWSCKWNPVYFVSTIGLIIIAWYLQGRGAAVTSILVVFFSTLLLLKNKLHQLLTILIAIIISLMTLSYAIMYHPRYVTLDHLSSLITGRFELWSAAIVIIKEHPWTGLGIGTWRNSAEVRGLTPVFVDEISPHNIVLDLVSSIGITGSIAFFVLTMTLIRALQNIPINLPLRIQRFGILILLAILINGMIDFRVFAPLFIAISGIGLLMWKGGVRNKNINSQ